MENESNVKHRINEFYGIFDKVLETEDPITDVEQLLVSFIDLEDKLFNGRVTKIFENLQWHKFESDTTWNGYWEPFFQGDSETLWR